MTRANRFSLRLRRSLRRSKRQVEGFGTQAEEGFEEHIVRRLGRLLAVRRFVGAWLGLLVLLAGILVVQMQNLSQYYQTVRPVPGGTYREGILGDFTNANPLYAVSPVDSAVSKLIFAGLFTYNSQNQLVGDLAKSWSVDTTGKIYTVDLRPDLQWQDSTPLTANDVVFTYNTIKNPDAQSPFNNSWQGVTIAAINSSTVTFTLPDPLTAFPYSLTTGIVPQHLLQNIPAVELRSAPFNTANPVGSGPFAWQGITVLGTSPTTREEQIALKPSTHYYAGPPKLAGFVVDAFHDQTELIHSFKQDQLDGLAGLDALPSQLAGVSNLQQYNFPLTDATMVFFKTSEGLLTDATLRRALVQAVNVPQLLNGLGYPVIPVREPLLNHQLGFDPAYTQASFNAAAAVQLLQSDGWAPGKGGILMKNNQPLTFHLSALDNSDDRSIMTSLERDWRAIGVEMQPDLLSTTDMQTVLATHSYDALLYSIAIGVDPDVFAYWDSSQANILSPTRLNFSEYKSAAADEALEAGRTRSDPLLRVIKYRPFLQAWQQDAPALGLYQPRFLYITRQPVAGLTQHAIVVGTDRFDNVANWEIREANVTD